MIRFNRKMFLALATVGVLLSGLAIAGTGFAPDKGIGTQTIDENQYLTHPAPTTATEGLPCTDTLGRRLTTLSMLVQGRPDSGVETDGGLSNLNALCGGTFETYRYVPTFNAGVLGGGGVDVTSKAWATDRTLQWDTTGLVDGGSMASFLGSKAVTDITPGCRIDTAAKGVTILYNDGGAILRVKLIGTYQ